MLVQNNSRHFVIALYLFINGLVEFLMFVKDLKLDVKPL